MTNRNGIAAWFAAFWRRRDMQGLRELQTKLRELELRMERMPGSGVQAPAPIVVEQIRIDKVVVDKIEYHNNFGALGIKELKGKLNIGANYTMSEGDTPMEEEGLEVLKEMRSAMGQARKEASAEARGSRGRQAPGKGRAGAGPELNIRAKPEAASRSGGVQSD